jgi:RNA polymerase sigma-70 factor, ECF subfamily
MRPDLAKAIDLLQRSTPEGVEEALGLLQNTVYSFSMKVCGHPEDAEDTMQEVLFRSLKHLSKIQDPKALSVWLYTVTRNRCWRMRRKPNGSARQVSIDELMPDDSELAMLLEDAASSPEINALQSEQQNLLQRAVLKIPVQSRLVLVLHDMEELTTEEVAQVLGLQPGTVRVRLHRARLAARKEMSQLMQKLGSVRAAGVGKAGNALRGKPAKKRRPAECRELFAQLSEYLDGRIEPATCEDMERHIRGCPACVVFLRDLRVAIERCRKLDVQCDPEVTKRLRAVLTREYLRLIGALMTKNAIDHVTDSEGRGFY